MTKPGNRKRKASENELVQQRVLDGECVRGCRRQAEDGSNYCIECGPKVRADDAARKKTKRDERHAAGQCVDCGCPAPKKPKRLGGGHKRRCRDCTRARRKKRAGSPRADLGVGREPMITIQQQRHALESRTWKDAGGRTRFHGRMRRGPPTKADSDLADLNDMQDTLNKAKAAFQDAQDPEVLAAPPIQREAWRKRWLAHIAHLGRYCQQLLGYDLDDDLDDPQPAKAAR